MGSESLLGSSLCPLGVSYQKSMVSGAANDFICVELMPQLPGVAGELNEELLLLWAPQLLLLLVAKAPRDSQGWLWLSSFLRGCLFVFPGFSPSQSMLKGGWKPLAPKILSCPMRSTSVGW